ncbi:hypothetical protein BGZ96_008389 [Linnemannia gamsii]|uniref:MARVEL domain-containing protein n=1 Tax=Linnemannia gamsii TaxID=64522 RepID=A0ABQ7JZ04_9FUNG|nr:hypothetical protein BGZ96_008389 [Linnemannia gamsii]
MLKKFGPQSSSNKDLDPPPRLSSNNIHPSTSSSAPTSPNRTTNNNNPSQDKDKKKLKKPLRTRPSSDSFAPRPHLPSTVYEPNPFPLDPTQPDGISRFNAFSAKEKHTRKEVREMEVVDIDIEIEETKGFVSGRSRQSIELDQRGMRTEYSRREVDVESEEREYELSKKGGLYSNKSAMSKLGAGLKGALMAKTGLGKGQDKDKERAGAKETTDPSNKPEEVDAVLQHHLKIQQQQEELHIRQQEQHYQQQQRYAQEQDVVSSSRGQRGRPRERQRTRSGPIHHQGRSGHNVVGRGSRTRGDEDDSGSPSSYHKENRDPFTDRKSRLHSLSPPPAPGQEHRGSGAYWPDSREGSHPDDQEQMSPFLPQTSSSHHYQQHHSRSQQQQQQYERSRALSPASDSDNNGDNLRHARDGRRHSRERNNEADRDRMRRDAGQRRQSGLYQVTNAASYDRTSSELAEEEHISAAARNDHHRSPQRSVPDRLSRAKEWVASHSKNTSIAAPAPVMDRETALASLPGAFPSRTPHRRSMDSFDDYAVITPPRGSYFANAGRGGGGYDPRERIVMVDQMRMQELQRSGYRNSMSMLEGDDGRGQYWNRQLEGYEQRDRYRQNRAEYEYVAGGGGQGSPYYGYAPGGPDDLDPYDETESTLAPGSAIGGVAKSKAGLEKQTDASKKVNPDGRSPLPPTTTVEEESQELQAKAPNKRRLILRLISLSSSLLVLVLLIAASPVSKQSSPFSTQTGLAFHYVVSIVSVLVSLAFLFNYFSRRLRRQEKMKRYLLFGLDILMSLLWLIDVFVCISKFPCGVGQFDGWCDMYNSSIFLGIVAFLSFLAAFIWDIWGSFDHSDSKLFGNGPWIKPPPPGFDRKALAKQGAGPAGWGGAQQQGQQGGVPPGAYPGQGAGAPGQGGAPKKPKNSKALW